MDLVGGGLFCREWIWRMLFGIVFFGLGVLGVMVCFALVYDSAYVWFVSSAAMLHDLFDVCAACLPYMLIRLIDVLVLLHRQAWRCYIA